MKLENILNKRELSKEDIIYLLEISDFRSERRLFEYADETRRKFCGDEVHLRGIIEFSNYCENNCEYCGIRKDNSSIERYRMNADEIINSAKQISNAGIRTLILQSGNDDFFDADQISYIIYSIKNNTDVSINLSLGERSFEEYKTWKYAGADRYILKYESSDEILDPGILNKKKENLLMLKDLGYSTGISLLIGLPNQTNEKIADKILFAKETGIDFISLNPFIPAPNTPFRNNRVGSVELTLKAISVARILLKNSLIPATAAIAAIDSLGREKALRAGANMVIPNFTPKNYKEKYSVYPHKKYLVEDPLSGSSYIEYLLNSLGRKAVSSYDAVKDSENYSQIF